MQIPNRSTPKSHDNYIFHARALCRKSEGCCFPYVENSCPHSTQQGKRSALVVYHIYLNNRLTIDNKSIRRNRIDQNNDLVNMHWLNIQICMSLKYEHLKQFFVVLETIECKLSIFRYNSMIAVILVLKNIFPSCSPS